MENRPRPRVDLTASCACGRVSVAFSGKVLAMFMCSCADCQMATGTGHSTVILASPADVTVSGESKSFARPADSGATFTRSFCPECGTPLFGVSSRAPHAIMLPAGLFAGANDWYLPNQLIFARSHRDWDLMPAGLPQHDTYRVKGELA